VALKSSTPAEPSEARTHSLGRQLVLATLVFCAAFTVLAVTARTWSAWKHRVAAMNEELVQVQKVFQRTLGKAIWEMDREALLAHVDSAVQVSSVGHVRLVLRRTNREPEVIEQAQPGWEASSRAPSLHTPLRYEPYPGAAETVGELVLEGDERVLWQRLQSELMGIMVTQLVQSLLLAGLVMWVFNRLVTTHVRHVASHVRKLTPETLKEPLRLERDPARHDELSLLEAGVNKLQDSLGEYLTQQRRDEQELAAHRDRLAELVQEKTAELQNANAQLHELLRSDTLTGLSNRRHFDEVKEIEFRRAKRLHQPLSVLLCDVDYFKRYNDTYGHAQGDACLQAVARVLGDSFGRAGELPARIGGEEFAVLLPGTDQRGAQLAAERLRAAVAARALPHAASEVAPHVTLSIGVAQFDPATMDRFDALLHRADEALYRAKRLGRDRVAA
jgi:diguanylate cyclase (GGDEF)-like protein